MTFTVPLCDIIEGYECVSSAPYGECSAYISRLTGKTWVDGDYIDPDEPLPADLGDTTIYLSFPHKHDLDLGRDLVMRFVEEVLPDSAHTVSRYFKQRGAYGRFKDFLSQHGKLETWHQYEEEATQAALLEWCQENDLPVNPEA